jgi:arylformamidase
MVLSIYCFKQLKSNFGWSKRDRIILPKYIDISRRLEERTAVWPKDTPFKLEKVLSLDQGDPVNLTTIHFSAHTGTHIDSPFHFAEKGSTIEQMELGRFWGRAQVVTTFKENGPLLPEDLDSYDLTLASRLLIRSTASQQPQSLFPEQYVYPHRRLADFLGEKGIILLGSDAPSMDHQNSKTLEGHQALLRNNIAILEWLDLSAVSDGIYEMVALPLNIIQGDGSPVRAVLRTLD